MRAATHEANKLATRGAATEIPGGRMPFELLFPAFVLVHTAAPPIETVSVLFELLRYFPS
jgi:hypothetical protein